MVMVPVSQDNVTNGAVILFECLMQEGQVFRLVPFSRVNQNSPSTVQERGGGFQVTDSTDTVITDTLFYSHIV